MQSTAETLRQIMDDGRFSIEALQAITGIDPEALAAVLRDRRPPTMMVPIEPLRLSPDESARLSTLAAQLTVGSRSTATNASWRCSNRSSSRAC